MTQQDFNHILSSIKGLSADQTRRLARELECNMAEAARKRRAPVKVTARQDAEETAFDVASRAGLIGCIKGAPRSPPDLSTSPKHMADFGRE